MSKTKVLLPLLVVSLVAGYFLFRKPQVPQVGQNETNESVFVSAEMEKAFNVVIPDNAETAKLVAVTGGSGSAVATRLFENNSFTHVVLADLPDPEINTFYQGWLARGIAGEPNFEIVSTGEMSMVKGGYLLEFTSSTNYSDYSKVIITKETTRDTLPEVYVLEGNF